MPITTYLEQIKQRCKEKKVSFRHAFDHADIHEATYSRTARGLTQLKLRTAQRLDQAIDEIVSKRRGTNRVVNLSERRQPNRT